jgi:hypothetical protein
MRLTTLRSDDRGSLPMVLLVITIGLGLSALLAPLVVRQIQSTRVADDRSTALNAVQAGLDVMMARVRAAADGVLAGRLEDLPPCTFEGDAGVSGISESMKYKGSIKYLDQDGKTLGCPERTNVDDRLNQVPAKALVVVQGHGSDIVRELSATYIFHTDNTNIPGGQINIASSPLGNDQCIDATDVPVVGKQVIMQRCNGSNRQQFGYSSDLYLKLINSESTDAPDGLCLHTGATHTNSSMVAFQKCPPASDLPTVPRQPLFQWSLDGSSMFHSVNGANGKTESFCMTVKTPAATGGNVGLGACTVKSDVTVWRSAAGVGAGMASSSTAQLVNYAQFSRCLDLTDHDVNKTYMIAWFCKQSPDGIVDYNQRWFQPSPVAPAISASGNIVVNKSGVDYCLRSPLSPALKVYTTVTPCAGNKTLPATQWTVWLDTGSYATSYRITDSAGYCLMATDQNAVPKDAHGDGTSKVKVAECTSSELQKWNAPPNIDRPTPLTDLREN